MLSAVPDTGHCKIMVRVYDMPAVCYAQKLPNSVLYPPSYSIFIQYAKFNLE